MTQDVDSGSHCERDNLANEHDDVEITEAMIEAGETALLFALGGAVSEPWFPREVATSVYRAMASRHLITEAMVAAGLAVFRSYDRRFETDDEAVREILSAALSMYHRNLPSD